MLWVRNSLFIKCPIKTTVHVNLGVVFQCKRFIILFVLSYYYSSFILLFLRYDSFLTRRRLTFIVENAPLQHFRPF